jgi:hypothetical protein
VGLFKRKGPAVEKGSNRTASGRRAVGGRRESPYAKLCRSTEASGIAVIQGIWENELNIVSGPCEVVGGEILIYKALAVHRVAPEEIDWFRIDRQTMPNFVGADLGVFERDRAEWVGFALRNGRYSMLIQPDDLDRWDTYLQSKGVVCAGRDRSAMSLLKAPAVLESQEHDGQVVVGSALAWDHQIDFWNDATTKRKTVFWSQFLSSEEGEISGFLRAPESIEHLGDPQTRGLLLGILSHPVPLAQIAGDAHWQAAIVPDGSAALVEWKRILAERRVRTSTT